MGFSEAVKLDSFLQVDSLQKLFLSHACSAQITEAKIPVLRRFQRTPFLFGREGGGEVVPPADRTRGGRELINLDDTLRKSAFLRKKTLLFPASNEVTMTVTEDARGRTNNCVRIPLS